MSRFDDTGEGAFDLVLVGGGLANGLLAYRLKTRRPDLRILLLEAGERLGGDHTWSFHETDLSAEQAAWLDAFVVHRWPAYEVAFRGLVRRVPTPYRSVTSGRFHDVLEATLRDAVRLRTEVSSVEPTRVVLLDGKAIEARAVVDGRGHRASPHLTLAWQKFLGLELRFTRPHGLEVPVLMDATVEQVGGYRFVYILPFGPDTALVEDTYYADGRNLDEAALRTRIGSYLDRRGWRVAEVLREERGTLPITLAGDIGAFWRGVDMPLSGLRAGLYHPTTGYSLPDAVRLADAVAGLSDLSAPALLAAIRSESVRNWHEHGFFRTLNRMLFRAGRPEERHRMLHRFYGLPRPTIERFYAGRLAAADKARLLLGRPPVPILGAARAALDLSVVAR